MSVNVDDGSVESTLAVRAATLIPTLNSVDDLEQSHGMDRERTLHTPHPPPIQCAAHVAPNVVGVPRNAKKITNAALAIGWRAWITHAVGFDTNASGSVKTVAIMEPTGEETPTGRPAMKEVSHVQAPPVNSYRVVIETPDRILVGHWIPGWDCGVVLARPVEGKRSYVLVRNCDWSGLWKEFTDAESRAHLCGENGNGQLSLTGDDGQPL
jgi:hypothetical protein